MAKKPNASAPPKGAPQPAAASTVSLDTISQLLMMTPNRVLQLRKDGWIPNAGRGVYSIVGAVQGYIRFLKDEARRTSKSASSSRLQDARAREVDLRVAAEEKRLVDIDDVQATVEEIVGGLRAELSGLPAACTRDLELRRTIEKHLNGAIDRCRERFEKAQRAAWDGSESALEE